MRLVQDSSEISSSVEMREFSIKSSPKAFRILSSGLYQNKIGSIVREIGFNAKDSHVAAGSGEKFVIHLPTRLDSRIIFEDFGVGLSEEDIKTVLTTYFESTKTDRDDAVGAWGLGFKSPFSYTEAFNVSSRFGGKKIDYACIIAEDGMPSIAKLMEVEHDGPSGITVEIPVKDCDVGLWHEEVKNQLWRISDSFEIAGGDRVKFVSPIFTTPNFDYYDVIPHRHAAKYFFADMGGVLYPIDLNEISKELDVNTAFMKNFAGKIILKFKIGEIEPSASREGLQYTAMTKRNLIAKFNDVTKHAIKRVVGVVVGCASIQELVKAFHEEMANENASFENKFAVSCVGNNFSAWYRLWRTETDRSHFPIEATYDIGGDFVRSWKIDFHGDKINMIRKLLNYDLRGNSNVTFFYGEPKSLAKARAYCQKHVIKSAFFVVKHADVRMRLFDGENLIDADAIDKTYRFVPGKRAAATKKLECKFLRGMNPNRTHIEKSYVEVREYDPNVTYLLVRCEKVYWSGGGFSVKDGSTNGFLLALRNRLFSMGLIQSQMIAFSDNDKKIPGDLKFVEVKDVMKEVENGCSDLFKKYRAHAISRNVMNVFNENPILRDFFKKKFSKEYAEAEKKTKANLVEDEDFSKIFKPALIKIDKKSKRFVHRIFTREIMKNVDAIPARIILNRLNIRFNDDDELFKKSFEIFEKNAQSYVYTPRV